MDFCLVMDFSLIAFRYRVLKVVKKGPHSVPWGVRRPPGNYSRGPFGASRLDGLLTFFKMTLSSERRAHFRHSSPPKRTHGFCDSIALLRYGSG